MITPSKNKKKRVQCHSPSRALTDELLQDDLQSSTFLWEMGRNGTSESEQPKQNMIKGNNKLISAWDTKKSGKASIDTIREEDGYEAVKRTPKLVNVKQDFRLMRRKQRSGRRIMNSDRSNRMFRKSSKEKILKNISQDYLNFGMFNAVTKMTINDSVKIKGKILSEPKIILKPFFNDKKRRKNSKIPKRKKTGKKIEVDKEGKSVEQSLTEVINNVNIYPFNFQNHERNKSRAANSATPYSKSKDVIAQAPPRVVSTILSKKKRSRMSIQKTPLTERKLQSSRSSFKRNSRTSSKSKMSLTEKNSPVPVKRKKFAKGMIDRYGVFLRGAKAPVNFQSCGKNKQEAIFFKYKELYNHGVLRIKNDRKRPKTGKRRVKVLKTGKKVDTDILRWQNKRNFRFTSLRKSRPVTRHEIVKCQSIDRSLRDDFRVFGFFA